MAAALALRPSDGGVEVHHTNEASTCPGTLHGQWEIGTLAAGSALLISRELEVALEPDDLFVIPPNVPHELRTQEQSSLCVMRIPTDIAGVADPHRHLAPMVLRNCSRRDELCSLCQHIAGASSAVPAELVQTLSRFLAQLPGQESVEPLPGPVRRMRQHLHENITEAVDLDNLATVARLSRFHAARQFRRFVGA